jgi:catechol 2,3-dioxygenase-like lactoylglutathione lyase family enzyme
MPDLNHAMAAGGIGELRSMTTSGKHSPRLIGLELYFDDVPRAREFYCNVLGLPLDDEQSGHHAKLAPEGAFLCLECKGVENYQSADKAVVFLEVADLKELVGNVGAERFVRIEPSASPPWAVLHDPEGHNVVIIEAAGRGSD